MRKMQLRWGTITSPSFVNVWLHYQLGLPKSELLFDQFCTIRTGCGAKSKSCVLWATVAKLPRMSRCYSALSVRPTICMLGTKLTTLQTKRIGALRMPCHYWRVQCLADWYGRGFQEVDGMFIHLRLDVQSPPHPNLISQFIILDLCIESWNSISQSFIIAF